MASIQTQLIENSNNAALAKASSKTPNASSSTNTISSDAFMHLMCMQLQYQDPMNPMDNSQMLAQEAQFVTLEQMEKLASSFSTFSSMYQANSLIGQNVEVKNSKGDTIKGVVEYIDYTDKSGASVCIDGTLHPLDSVTKVYPKGSSETDKEDRNFFKEILSYTALNVGSIAKKLGAYIGGDEQQPDGGSDGGSEGGNTEE